MLLELMLFMLHFVRCMTVFQNVRVQLACKMHFVAGVVVMDVLEAHKQVHTSIIAAKTGGTYQCTLVTLLCQSSSNHRALAKTPRLGEVNPIRNRGVLAMSAFL